MPKDSRAKLNQVLEAYKPMPMRRMFYPRGFQLSDNFINAFHEEYDRLVHEGINPRTLVERFGKALRFHVNEKRRYTSPVVEGQKEKKKFVKKGSGLPKDNPAPEGSGTIVKPFGTKERD